MFDSYIWFLYLYLCVFIYIYILYVCGVENPSNIPLHGDEVVIKASEVCVGVVSLRIIRNTVHNPIGSMYGIFTYIWLISMVNVGKYTIHGSYGICSQSLPGNSFHYSEVERRWFWIQKNLLRGENALAEGLCVLRNKYTNNMIWYYTYVYIYTHIYIIQLPFF